MTFNVRYPRYFILAMFNPNQFNTQYPSSYYSSPAGTDPAAATGMAASASSGLPTGWEVVRNGQQVYYVHSQSQHAQWERPGPLLPGWVEAIHQHGEGKGQLYYFNTVTREKRHAVNRPENKSGPSSSRTGGRTYVAPNRTTYPGGSWGCERRAAAIEGSTTDFRNNADIEAVCIRFLQTDTTLLTYKVVVSFVAYISFVNFALLTLGSGHPLQQTMNVAAITAGTAVITTHAGVIRQYSSVHEQCQEYLANRFGQQFVEQIKTMKFNKKGLNDVIKLLSLHEPEIRTFRLDAQLRKLENQDTQSALTQLLNSLRTNLLPEVRLDPEPHREA